MNVDLNIEGDLEVLRLQPNDVIVVSLKRSITADQAQRISEELDKRFPRHTVLIMADGIEVSVQREVVA